MPYLLAFCRIVTGFVFAASFWGKVQNISQFIQTITNFKLLPNRWSQPVALLFLMGELTVVILVIIRGRLLLVAFGLAALLLIVFTTALAFVLKRNAQTPCNCFGENEEIVTKFDVWRNACLIACAISGWILNHIGHGRGVLAWAEYMMLSVVSILFVIFITNLKEFISLFKTT